MRPVLGLERSQSPCVMKSRHSRAWLSREIQAWASSPHSPWPGLPFCGVAGSSGGPFLGQGAHFKERTLAAAVEED